MGVPYFTIVTDQIENDDIKEAYALFRAFEEAGQLTDKEVESLEKKFDDPSISRQDIANALSKVKKLDPVELKTELKKLDESRWRRFRTDLNVSLFSD